MTAPLEITNRLFSDAGVILTLSGSLVADEGYRLLSERVAAVVSSGAAHVLLDLRDVATSTAAAPARSRRRSFT